jgi:hypothetical protein
VKLELLDRNLILCMYMFERFRSARDKIHPNEVLTLPSNETSINLGTIIPLSNRIFKVTPRSIGVGIVASAYQGTRTLQMVSDLISYQDHESNIRQKIRLALKPQTRHVKENKSEG